MTVVLRDAAHSGGIRRALHEQEIEEDVRRRLGGRVVVGGGDDVVFLYTSTREAAREAERVVREILTRRGFEADVAITRWHSLEERWEDERVPPPTAETAREVEHEQLEEDEAAESEQLGAALWEVRIVLDSHHDAVAFAERLEAERDRILPGWSFSVVRRWKYLLIGADNEDQAKEIAKRLEGELPPGAAIEVEPSGALAWQAVGTNPFAVFGGLGG